jgi:phage replication-related protein YjqB (UPF0714/DUF867 family)
MADKYANWAALAAVEKVGIDYRIITNESPSTVSHIAIHAGGIESGSGELAKAVTQKTKQALYCMEAMKSSGNQDLHITATNFDEPRCVAIQSKAFKTISYHGFTGTDARTYVGGLDTALAKKVGDALAAKGFVVDFNPPEGIPGLEPKNIANRNRSGAGVQLELTNAQRAAFYPDGNTGAPNRQNPEARTQAFWDYVDAIVSVVAEDSPTYNRPMVWDGSQWAEKPLTYWDGKYHQEPTVLVWDGQEWMYGIPEPWEYPQFSWASANAADDVNEITEAIDLTKVRLGDLVVSVCISYDADPAPEPLLDECSMHTYILAPTGLRMDVAMFPWSPQRGNSVTWKVKGAEYASLMNLTYRHADNAHAIERPEVVYNAASNVGSMPLPTSGEYVDMFIAMAVSSTIGNVKWPTGVKERASAYGTHGTQGIRISVGDVHGDFKNVGDIVYVNGQAEAFAVARVTIPGVKGKGPRSWILDNEPYSILGATTMLG